MKQKIGQHVYGAMALLAWGLLAFGCVDINYVGQTFPALPTDDPVAFYNQSTKVPEQPAYRSIGRVTLTAPDGTNSEEIRADLLKLAREKGANAVKIVTFERILTGSHSAMTMEQEGPNSVWNDDARNPDGSYITTNSFGESRALKTGETEVYEIRVKALLLVPEERFVAVRDQWQEEQQAAGEALSDTPVIPLVDGQVAQELDRAVTERQIGTETAAEAMAQSESEPKTTQVELRDQPITL